ncbi:MAG: substrate-binding domain-containing protein [Sedimentisphaerales bacterium]
MAVMTKTGLVVRHVRSKIASGTWLRGEKLPVDQIIQSELGVSRTAVREAFSALVSEGLIVRRQKAGTFVSDETKEGIIAILCPIENLTSSKGYFYQTCVSEAQKLIKLAGYRAVLTVGHGPTTEAFCESTHLFDQSIRNQILGVISIGGIGELRKQIEAAGMYCVCSQDETHNTNTVILPHKQVIEMGVEYLKSRGHFDFALMYCDSPQDEKEDPSELRRKRMEHWVESCGITLKKERFLPVPLQKRERRAAYDIFRRFWSSPDHPKAILFTDDVLCEISGRAIVDLGIKVPQELSVITHSNSCHEIIFPVTLTKVEFKVEELINAAFYMLQNMINTRKKEQPFVQIYPKIIEGKSVMYA